MVVKWEAVVEAITAPGTPCAASHSLTLLGTFEFRVHDVRIELPGAAERLVAFLALQVTSVSRYRVAAALWPDASEQRSLGCLRSVLWRVRMASRTVIEPSDARLGLASGTRIDIAALSRQTHRLLDSLPTRTLSPSSLICSVPSCCRAGTRTGCYLSASGSARYPFAAWKP